MENATPQPQSTGEPHKSQAATTRRWCIYGILAWGLAAGLYFLLNVLVLGIANMVSTPPSGPRVVPTFIWLRVMLLLLPVIPLLWWFRITGRSASRGIQHAAMIVAMLGIALHFGWVLYFVSMLSG